jgi:glycosyltransferase involved in cell wall biosynthesis
MIDFHVILTQDLSSPSGLGRYLPLSKELSSIGYKVRIIATHSNYNSTVAKHQRINNLSIYYISQSHVYKDGNFKYYFPVLKLIRLSVIATIKFTKEALFQRAKVIIVGKPHPMNSIAGIIAKIIWKSTLIIDIDDDEENSNKISSNWQKWILGLFQKNVPKFADIVTTNTKFMEDKLIKYGVKPNQIYYLPNGIDITRFKDDVSYEDLLSFKELLGVNGKKIILYIGSISYRSHPIPLLLHAYKEVIKSVPDSVLIIVGGGEDVERMLEEIKNLNLDKNVIYVGKVETNMVIKYYLIADVTIDPVYDNDVARGRCPLKIFEAWFFGVPCITGDVGDRRMLAGDSPALLLCKPGDPIDLAKAIIEVISNPTKAWSLTSRGKSRLRYYTWGNLVSDFVEYLKSLDIC